MSTLEIASLALKLAKPVLVPLKKHCSYAFSYKRHLEELRAQLNQLLAFRDSIQDQVNASSRNVQQVETTVTTWLEQANEAAAISQTLLAKQTASAGSLLTRHSIASKASKLKNKMAELCATVPAIIPRRPGLEPLLVPPSNYTPFPSREPHVEAIMKALTSEGYEHVTIGIWGMGGVGKTTLVHEVYRQVVEMRLFGDDVTMATVTREVDLEKIQQDIAAMLGLKFKRGETIGQRASLLNKRLKKTQKEKALIILDDLWEALDLGAIGIPRNQGIKLVVTSRSRTVLAEMGSAGGLVFQLEPLSGEEAHDLFRSTAGKEAEESPVGIKLVEKCQGLPISIKALATTFKRNGGRLIDWGADKQMNQPNDAYSTLELSYHCLKEEDLKSLFLKCALFGAGSPIPVRDLIRYSLGSGIFEGIDRLSTARFRLRRLVERLSESSLVLADNTDDCIKMHDMVHEMAIRIAAKQGRVLVAESCSDYRKYPAEELRECTAISLPFVQVDDVLSAMIATNHFPKLTTFILIGKAESESADLPSELFRGMENLNVLDLSEMSFTTSLPSSIGGLLNLTTLCLDCCEGIGEECIVMIGGLSRLQVLSFMGSLITYLPKEIGQLGELRLLDLSKCSELRTIHPGVLRRLTNLEELFMENGFKNWEGRNDLEPANATLGELNGLSKLSTLDIHVQTATSVPENLPIITQLEKFRILIGDCWDWSDDQTESNILKLKGDSRSILLKGWVQAALDRTEDLHLDGLNGAVKKSLHTLLIGGFDGIKRLHVQNCPLIRYVVQSVRRTPPLPSFVKLETLYLHSLENLEQVCHGPPPKLPESFSHLKFVRVTNCRNLKNLFSASMVVRGGLPELEEIEISDCNMMTGIMQGDNGVEDDNDNDNNNVKVMLCNLRRLKLHKLPEFTTFCTKVDNDDDHTTSAISDGSSVATLFYGPGQQVSFPQLESLALSELGKLKEIWSGRHHSMEFCHLISLEVVNCGSLSLCIPFGILTSLKVLESLSIERCSSMQHVFDIGGQLSSTGGRNYDEEILPQLQKLTLVDLPDMTSILANQHAIAVITIFRKLKWVRVEKCDSLTNIFCLTTPQHLQNVETLRIVECKKVKAIINLADDNAGLSNQGSAMLTVNKLDLPMLEFLRLEKLHSLATFVNGIQDIACPQLQKMFIKECNQMKAFSTTSEARVPSVCFFCQKVSLPRLERLALESMESLEKIWPDEPSIEKVDSFSRLCSLRIIKCKKLSSSLVPTTLMDKLHKLEQVLVGECESLEVLFDCGNCSLIGSHPRHECEALMLPKLHRLTLWKLTELKYTCKGNTPLGLSSLNEVRVSNCKNLIHLFPEATARTLLQLKSLDIEKCEIMQQIMSKEDSEEQVVDPVPVSFPHLKQLKLSKLGKLSCFASGDCEFEFLSLEDLHISDCTGLKTLIQRPTFNNDPLDTKTPSFFDDKVEFPNLDNIKLYDVPVHKVWSDDEQQPLSDSFSKLKWLEIGSCANLVTVIPSNMLRRLGNLEKLKISNCIVLEEIFQLEDGLNHYEDATREDLNNEMLTNGSASGNPAIHKVEVSFPKLEFLELSGLGKLKEIWSARHYSSMELVNLKYLEVVDCGSISVCIPSGVVKSLNQLKSLTMKSCSSIKHVFDIQGLESSGRENDQEILLLPAMETMTLFDLSSMIGILTDNISANQTIFRSLKTVDVEKCHSLMNLFSLKTAQCLDNVLERLSIVECKEVRTIILVDSPSQDTLRFPELKFLKLEKLPLLAAFVGGTQDIAGPVCLFSQKVSLPGLEILCIGLIESLEKIWSGELPNQESFSKLLVLRIIGCKKLTSPLVQINLTKKLQSLKEVTVEKCESMGVLFDYRGLYTSHLDVMLPELKILKVQELPELRYIFKGNASGVVPFSLLRLEQVELFKCNNLVHVFPNIATALTLSKLVSIKVGECESMEQVVSTVENRPEQVRNILFPRLSSVELCLLGRFYSFAPKSCKLGFPSLVTLSISECSSLKTFIDGPAVQDDRLNLTVHSLFNDKVEFPKLEKLLLCEVGMEKVWNNDRLIPASSSFSELKSLKIERCQNMVTIIPSNMITRLQNLEKIVVHNCIELKELLQLEGLNQQQEDANEEMDFKKLEVVCSGCPALDQYHTRIKLVLQKIQPQ